MTDIGGNWDRRGQFLYIKEENVIANPCEISASVEIGQNRYQDKKVTNELEIKKIIDLFNGVAPKKSIKYDTSLENAETAATTLTTGKSVEVTISGKTYTITPLQSTNKALEGLIRQGEKIRYVAHTEKPTVPERRVESAATKGKTAPARPAAPLVPPRFAPATQTPQGQAWDQLDTYIVFKSAGKINYPCTVKQGSTQITDRKVIASVSERLTEVVSKDNNDLTETEKELKQKLENIKSGAGASVDVVVDGKRYQVSEVNYKELSNDERDKLGNLIVSRQQGLNKTRQQQKGSLSVSQTAQEAMPIPKKISRPPARVPPNLEDVVKRELATHAEESPKPPSPNTQTNAATLARSSSTIGTKTEWTDKDTEEFMKIFEIKTKIPGAKIQTDKTAITNMIVHIFKMEDTRKEFLEAYKSLQTGATKVTLARHELSRKAPPPIPARKNLESSQVPKPSPFEAVRGKPVPKPPGISPSEVNNE